MLKIDVINLCKKHCYIACYYRSSQGDGKVEAIASSTVTISQLHI
ncbi:hypothetical protein [Nostoc sp. PCC 7524]|nr:hypothetical protein [Nostoc sp. PCC 7524]